MKNKCFGLVLPAIMLVCGVILTGCKPVGGDGGGSDTGVYGLPRAAYTVTYDGNGNDDGTVPADKNKYAAGNHATALGNDGELTKADNEFVGWNTQADGEGDTYHPGASISISANLTLYARWTTDATYTITYNGNKVDSSGTVPVDTNKYIAGDKANVLGNSGNLAKSNYNFVAWNTKADGTGTAYPADNTVTVGNADIVLYASWSRITALRVTYDKNSGDGDIPFDNTEYDPGDTVTVLDNTDTLARSGYRFDGWNTKTNGSGTTYQSGKTFTITKNTTLYVKWTPVYAVTYSGNNNTDGTVPVDSAQYLNGATVTVLGNTGTLARTGYIFDGWNTLANGTGTTYQPASTFPITANTTLYAKWKPFYTVTYNGNGNTGGTVPVDSSSPYLSGDTVTVLGQGNLARTGYVFEGWSISIFAIAGTPLLGTTYQPADTFKIAVNTTLYAKWARICTLTYDGNGSDSGDIPAGPATYTSGATVLGNSGSLGKAGKIFDGWNTKADGTGNWYWPGDSINMTDDMTLYAVWVTTTDRVFNATTADNNGTWYTVTAKRLAVGKHAIVYADATAGVTASTGQAIAAKYDSSIYSQITGTFGGINDVDKNGRVIFLLLDIIDGYTGSGGYVAGYFQPTHMYAKTTYAKSNEADMLFMDVNPAIPGTQGFYSTMAHELQHLIEHSETVAKGKGAKEIWIDEGLSTAAEYIYGNGNGVPAQNTSRINYFNNDPYDTIVYGNNFFVWNGWWEMPANGEDVLADYASAYLFFQWLRIHASNDIGIYKEIIASSYADYRAVTYPAYSRTYIPLLSSTDWAKLLSSWMIANVRKDSTGVYGYKGQISPVVRVFDLGATPFDNYFVNEFAPGEGIYSNLAGWQVTANNVNGSGTNIKYVGIPASGTPDTSAPYIGNLLLTYNANTNTESYSHEGGLVLNRQNSGSSSNMLLSRNRSVSTEPLPTSYPVDVHFNADGTVSQAGANVPTKKGVPRKELVPIDKN
ncbi:MAG: hypothetical protein Ta2A_14610 [Treponemataceae bacterium]|nr:MAG: hypothetical protein Ta2A_14610 [Treponemataceae bacterium]